MKNKKTTRFVVMVTALGSMGLLAAMQGCSSSSDDAPADPDSGASSSSNSSSSSTSSSGGQDSGTDANKPDAKTDSGTDAGACFDNIRTVDGGSDGGTVKCPGAGECAAICTAIYTNFKADDADDIIKKLVPASDCVDVDTTTKLRAGLLAKVQTTLASACADLTATQWCTAVVSACGGQGMLSQPDCEKVAKGLTGTTKGAGGATGRAAAERCFLGADYQDCGECMKAVQSGVDFPP